MQKRVLGLVLLRGENILMDRRGSSPERWTEEASSTERTRCSERKGRGQMMMMQQGAPRGLSGLIRGLGGPSHMQPLSVRGCSGSSHDVHASERDDASERNDAARGNAATRMMPPRGMMPPGFPQGTILSLSLSIKNKHDFASLPSTV